MTKSVDSPLPPNSYHQFYINKFRSLSTTAQLINEEIEELKKLAPLRFRGLIKREYINSLVKTPKNSVPRKTGVIYLSDEIDATRPPIIRPDQKRCQKRLINKGQMDMEYLQQVEEELLSSKKIDGKTSSGTQELNDLIKSMAQRIQHGSKNRKEEAKIHDKLRELKITRETYTAPEPIPIPSSYYEIPYPGWRYQRKQFHRKVLKNIEILEKDRMGYKISFVGLLAMLHDVKRHIFYSEKELEKINFERRITYSLIRMLHHLQETCYDEYESLSLNVKDLAGFQAKVEQLCDTQVEWFKVRWNENEAFRDDLY